MRHSIGWAGCSARGRRGRLGPLPPRRTSSAQRDGLCMTEPREHSFCTALRGARGPAPEGRRHTRSSWRLGRRPAVAHVVDSLGGPARRKVARLLRPLGGRLVVAFRGPECRVPSRCDSRRQLRAGGKSPLARVPWRLWARAARHSEAASRAVCLDLRQESPSKGARGGRAVLHGKAQLRRKTWHLRQAARGSAVPPPASSAPAGWDCPLQWEACRCGVETRGEQRCERLAADARAAGRVTRRATGQTPGRPVCSARQRTRRACCAHTVIERVPADESSRGSTPRLVRHPLSQGRPLRGHRLPCLPVCQGFGQGDLTTSRACGPTKAPLRNSTSLALAPQDEGGVQGHARTETVDCEGDTHEHTHSQREGSRGRARRAG